ncbi:hypothetical protein P154DRAFT_324556 [Amniculicola lignicola CBS 123094]|uniref:SWIM-type domain-containing protein n=1 Tax=Amniculicola lignicola CBS 123094 TaxID=1392246 RepID=A0A6A5W7K5_9PLEO|nr:hypothetical protein P154DRAFT_324556 [Amniculicola lignicola CBS 123094]
MSAEELAKLSLSETMVTTRAGAARAKTAPVQRSQTQPLSPSLPTSEQSSPTASIIESASGLKYNVSPFDDEVRKRAARGLRGDNAIKMKYCRSSGRDQNEYMFYINDDITVAMGGRYTIPKCSCGANEGENACKHIFWMLDQLTTGAPETMKSQTLQLVANGSAVNKIRPSDMVDKITLYGVAEGLDWILHEDPLPEDDEIEDEITDMLSVFEPSAALPSEFKSPGSPYLSEQSRKFREFKDLFIQYATEDLGLLGRLRAVITPDFQTQVFFDKINDRIVRAFRALDQYIEHGPTSTSMEAYDVTTCAAKLKTLVTAIDEYYQQQLDNGSDTKNVTIRTAAALISVLNGVVSRDFDIYQNITWGGIDPMDPAQNNLFACLIGSPFNDDDGKFFVIDELTSLPHDDVLRNHWEVLFSIVEKLEQQWTPPPFLTAFRAFTTENKKRAAPEEGGSSAKRAAMQ